MRFEGKLVAPAKGKKLWAVEISSMDIYTQGTSRKNALEMACEALELLGKEAGLAFSAVIIDLPKTDRFLFSAREMQPFISFTLKRMREARNLTLMQMAERLKSASPNSFGRYEQGKSSPSIEKLEELYRALDPSIEMVVKIA